jgi:hypothetical protein
MELADGSANGSPREIGRRFAYFECLWGAGRDALDESQPTRSLLSRLTAERGVNMAGRRAKNPRLSGFGTPVS